MKQFSEKCMMVLVCLMLSGCGPKAQMYLEQSGTEISEDGASGQNESDGAKPQGASGENKTDYSREDAKDADTSGQTQQTQDGSGTQKNNGRTIAVYVCGEVKQPGVYELTEGMRICDAVEAAGGFTKEAGREYWNLAELLTDGQMLCVPTEAEAKERKAAEERQQTSSAEHGQQSETPVNINTADATLLTSVPGIGQVRAEAVIAYRREHGDFQRTEDIKKVSGIGDALFAKMKDYITVS